jgi:hypothetical protein
MGVEVYAPPFLRMGTMWERWMINFTLWPFYAREEISLYPLNSKLSEPQGRSRCQAEETNLLSRRKSNTDSSVDEPLVGLP